MFTLKARCCQSCGMPLWKDIPHYGGTNKDGSKSKKYCSYCWQNGEFTDPNLTLEEMIIKVKDRLHLMFMPKILMRYFTRGIPKLERWQKPQTEQIAEEKHS